MRSNYTLIGISDDAGTVISHGVINIVIPAQYSHQIHNFYVMIKLNLPVDICGTSSRKNNNTFMCHIEVLQKTH